MFLSLAEKLIARFPDSKLRVWRALTAYGAGTRTGRATMDGLAVRKIAPEQTADLVAVNPLVDPTQCTARWADGNACYVGFLDTAPICYAWVYANVSNAVVRLNARTDMRVWGRTAAALGVSVGSMDRRVIPRPWRDAGGGRGYSNGVGRVAGVPEYGECHQPFQPSRLHEDGIRSARQCPPPALARNGCPPRPISRKQALPMNASHVIQASTATPLDWQAWDAFVARAATGTFYHSSQWLRPVAAAMGQDIRVHVITNEDAVCAGAVVRCARRLGLTAGRKPWATAYNGVVADVDADADALRAELLRRYHHVRLVQAPAASASAKPTQDGWRIKLGATPVLDVSDLDRSWQSFDRHARQRVRKAESLGVTTTETDNYAAFHALYASTYERQGLPMPLRGDQLAEVLRLATGAGATKCYMGTTETGQPAAFLVVGFDSKRAYFVLAASDPAHRKTDAVTLLWWHAMKACAETHREIDLVGMATPAIARFKASFSPVQVEYEDWSAYAASPWGWAARCADAAPTVKRRIAVMLSSRGEGMSVLVRSLAPSQYPEWNALVRGATSGTVYHETTWLEPVCAAAGDTLAVYGFFLDGQLVAGIPTQIRRKKVFSMARRAFATPYAGLVVRDELDAAARARVVAELDGFGRAFSHTTLTFSPFSKDPTLIPGWQRNDQATYLVRFGSLAALWRTLASEVRNRIRKAERQGITVTEDFAPGEFYTLFRDLFGRQGSSLPFDESTFALLLQRLRAADIARAYLARCADGTPCAACLLVHDRRRAYYSLAASHPSLRKTGAPSLLVWQALNGYEGQVREFDFGGANIPRITQFKSKFRGQLITYPEVSRYRSLPERLAIELYQRLRARRHSNECSDE